MNARAKDPGLSKAAAAAASAITHTAPEVLFAPFTWLAPGLKGDRHGEFLSLTRDVARGAELVMQIALADRIDRDAGCDVMLNYAQTERLMMFAQRSLQMLGDRCEATMSELADALPEVKS